MPAIVDGTSKGIKRKRQPVKEGRSKRPRSESSDEDEQAQILLLESEIFESKKNYNNIAKLISILRDDNEDADSSVVAAISLCRVFTKFMVSEEMSNSKRGTEKDAIVIRWLKERYSDYKTTLLALLGEEGVDATALTLCMRLLQTEGEYLKGGQDYDFPTSFLTSIVHALLNSQSDGSARKEFSEKYAEDNDDIRFYTFEAIE